MTTFSNAWFPEPSTDDPTYQKNGENTIDWLNRSTWIRAKECRKFLNGCISKLPEDMQQPISHEIVKDFESGYFELMAGICLQEMGAEITYEVASGKGNQTIDFLAEFQDASILVEAIAPQIFREVGIFYGGNTRLINCIEKYLPEGWLVCVRDLPIISPSQSIKEFEKVVKSMLAVPKPLHEDEVRELTVQFNEDIIGFTLIAAKNEKKYEHVASLPAFATWDDTAERVTHSVRKKRQKGGDGPIPLIIAIRGTAFGRHDVEEFDISLFGRTSATVDNFGNVLEKGFIASGELAKSKSENPSIAGVLAFPQVGWTSCAAPIFYKHPKFIGNLPDSLLQLERRELINYSEIKITSTKINPFENIRFVDPKMM